MLDIKLIREDPEPFRQALARRGLAERVDELLAADERRRELTQRVEALRAEQNRASKAIGRASGDEKQTLIAEVAKVSAELKELEPEHAEAETALTLLLASTPNLPLPTASPTRMRSRCDASVIRRDSTSSRRIMPSWGQPWACWTSSEVRERAGRGSSTCSATSCSSSSR